MVGTAGYRRLRSAASKGGHGSDGSQGTAVTPKKSSLWGPPHHRDVKHHQTLKKALVLMVTIVISNHAQVVFDHCEGESSLFFWLDHFSVSPNSLKHGLGLAKLTGNINHCSLLSTINMNHDDVRSTNVNQSDNMTICDVTRIN